MTNSLPLFSWHTINDYLSQIVAFQFTNCWIRLWLGDFTSFHRLCKWGVVFKIAILTHVRSKTCSQSPPGGCWSDQSLGRSEIPIFDPFFRSSPWISPIFSIFFPKKNAISPEKKSQSRPFPGAPHICRVPRAACRGGRGKRFTRQLPVSDRLFPPILDRCSRTRAALFRESVNRDHISNAAGRSWRRSYGNIPVIYIYI